MPRKPIRSLRCPSCRALVLAGEKTFPFCSDRCKLIDLGKWASGGYVISTPITDPEQLEGMLHEQGNAQGDARKPGDRRKARYSSDRPEHERETQTGDEDCHETS